MLHASFLVLPVSLHPIAFGYLYPGVRSSMSSRAELFAAGGPLGPYLVDPMATASVGSASRQRNFMLTTSIQGTPHSSVHNFRIFISLSSAAAFPNKHQPFLHIILLEYKVCAFLSYMLAGQTVSNNSIAIFTKHFSINVHMSGMQARFPQGLLLAERNILTNHLLLHLFVARYHSSPWSAPTYCADVDL